MRDNVDNNGTPQQNLFAENESLEELEPHLDETAITEIDGLIKKGGCCSQFNRRLADFVLTTDEDKLLYLKQYNCNPPPLFILIVSLAEGNLFWSADRTRQRSTMLNGNVTKNMNKALPAAARALIRNGALKRVPTKTHCGGYKQANIVILPHSLAGSFGKFAKENAAPVPLLHTSKPGEFDAQGLCSDSDIRTDVPLYNVVKNGTVTAQAEHLKDFDMTDMVTFYIGCSFSFYQALVDCGLSNENEVNENVPMFTTDVDCHPHGPFKCKMVVSMRPVHESKLNLAVDVTSTLQDVHGAPIHIGNPGLIGIKDASKVGFGQPTDVADDFVPVFWACGVTGLEAVRSSNCDLAFTHAPGHMFITDMPQITPKIEEQPPEFLSEVVKFSSKNSCYSVLSKRAMTTLNKLAALTEQDPGNRGIEHLVVPGDFAKASLALSHARSVALITGFPVHDFDPPDETDGLPGIFSLAAALQAAGKDVTLIVDTHRLEFNKSIAQRCHENGLLPSKLQIISFSQSQSDDPPRRFDVVLASERVGRSQNGHYYGMKGKDLSERVDPIDIVFEAASKSPEVVTISIGDGGNELGMGKVVEKVRRHIPLGDKVACVVAADLVCAAGTSNWGCYAFGIALYVLKSCSIHERYLRRGIGFPSDNKNLLEYLPTVTREREILKIVEDFGIRDGISPNQDMSVDGMYFDGKHAEVINSLRSHAGL